MTTGVLKRFIGLSAAALCVLATMAVYAENDKKPTVPPAAASKAKVAQPKAPAPPGATKPAPAPTAPPATAPPAVAPEEPAAPPPPAPSPAPAPPAEIRRNEKGEPLITNVFADTDLRQALGDIAAQASVTIIPDATVQGTVSADLKDVPLEKALDMILSAGGFAWRQREGYYLVGAPTPENPNFTIFCDTEVVALRYVDCSTLADYLGGPYKPYIAVERPRPQAVTGQPQRMAGARAPTEASAGRNRLIITAPPSIMKRIKEDLARIDVPARQVMLEASVIELTEEALKEVGIDWTLRHFQVASQAMVLGGITGQNATQLEPGSLTYTEVANKEMATLKALLEKGQARLRANPRVATADGETAEIQVGQESYFAIITGPVTFPYTTLEQIPSGITLRITPRVVEETREIIADVYTDVRDVTGTGANNLPVITYRQASTRVKVKEGQGIVIGGLTTEVEQRTRRKVPFLGDLPLIGQLFRRSTTHTKTTEVIIVITPHILDDAGRYPGAPEPPVAR